MALLAEGQRIRDTYEVERLLGEGAFAEVYRVRHRFLGRQAMKVFKRAGLSMGELEQLLGEAVLLSRLGHPNIARVFDANTAETPQGLCGFFTMEYIAGGNLDSYWRGHGKQMMPVPTTVDLVRQVCRGLALAHSAQPPIIHRDVKPANILIDITDAGPHAKLSDFGLARHVNPLSMLASARGTLGFKAPETFRDPGADSAAGDVWAVGCTLYLLLTDEFPYPDAADPTPGKPPVYGRLVPPSTLNLTADSTLDAILARALSVRPRDRYPSAQPLLDDLEAWRPRPAQPPVPQEDREPPERLVEQALRMAREGGALPEAAQLLEEACRHAPALREQYEEQINLWRRGIAL
jgi:serine/threonine-protein kinase